LRRPGPFFSASTVHWMVSSPRLKLVAQIITFPPTRTCERGFMDSRTISAWGVDWAWGLLLILLIVVFHARCLGFIGKEIDAKRRNAGRLVSLWSSPTFIIGGTALAATILHGIEGTVWAGAFRLLRALPDNKSAMLYSLNAMTSYGHTNIHLAPGWEMMGALEALNGWILFGLTTAFLFNVIQKSLSQT
jgi:hypothetical protein